MGRRRKRRSDGVEEERAPLLKTLFVSPNKRKILSNPLMGLNRSLCRRRRRRRRRRCRRSRRRLQIPVTILSSLTDRPRRYSPDSCTP